MSNTKISRKTQKIFASDSGTHELAAFATMLSGSPVYTDNVETLQTANYEKGWALALADNYAPFMQEDNGVLYGITYQLAYILQTGIPEWSASEKYFQYNFCQKNGVIYMSKGDNNLNNDPALDTAGTYWDKKDIIQIATDTQAAAGLLETVAILFAEDDHETLAVVFFIFSVALSPTTRVS